MPDHTGKLSKEEGEHCNARFEKFEKEVLGKDLQCELCNGIVWALTPIVVSAMADSAAGPLGSTARIPMVQYVCANCGNIKSFSAAMWEIDPVPPRPSPKKKKKNGDSEEEEERHGN